MRLLGAFAVAAGMTMLTMAIVNRIAATRRLIGADARPGGAMAEAA